jgi:GNAT superfamily N-acetyltransferase
VETTPAAARAMNRAALVARTFDGLAEYYRLLADTEERSRVVESDGVVAAIVPATPHDAMFNTVVYEDTLDPQELERLAALYRRQGVQAWGIWLCEGDVVLQAALETRGFTPIRSWTGMGMPLLGDPPPLPADCEVLRASVRDFVQVNDSAHGVGEDYSRAFARWVDREDAALWALRCSGRILSTLLEIDCETDCSVNSVATVRGEWRKGMAGTLIQNVLAAARQAGCTTSTLQASPSAESLYRSLGYEPICAWTVWAAPHAHPINHDVITRDIQPIRFGDE